MTRAEVEALLVPEKLTQPLRPDAEGGGGHKECFQGASRS